MSLRFWTLSSFLGVFVSSLLTPSVAAAASSGFFGPIYPSECICDKVLGADGLMHLSAPDYGCVLQLFQHLINFGVSITIVFVVLVIAYAGFRFMTTGGSAEARQQARTLLLNAVVGLAVVLSAWLIVDFIMKELYNPGTAIDGQTFGPWNEILKGNNVMCIQVKSSNTSITDGQVTAFKPGTYVDSGGHTVSATGGTCTVPTTGTNPCSTQALSSTCFGSAGANASQICMMESAGGQSNIHSGSDKLNSGSGDSYSIGLWQINLTTTPLVDKNGTALNCPDAFTAHCGRSYGTITGPSNLAYCTATIKPGRQELYKQCVAAAETPTVNSQAACKLYGQNPPNGGFQPWAYSANRCNVPKH